MNNPRPDPIIPDHEVLRKIGGGAYGEVWLARGVTGALRAVKVLWREDFEDERSFEREFEGILKFEPISRDHPGMVNILHVGRSPDGKSFYYYVMELGDDVIAGRDINPVEYEARTLRSDTKRTPGRRLDTGFCIDVGVRLAEALRHLHDNGLAHRDVKPANVIFVSGRAKLADIGLVAARGQRTFVGTEGFVPPEGPGSAQADVYSLGKVLYEIATGKDRMEFPELPDELPTGSERKRWLQLNQIICDVCEPHLSKRRISTAGDLADALRRLQEGKRRRRRRPVGAMIAGLMVLGIAAYGTRDWIKQWFEPPPPKVLKIPAGIRITSEPSEANVFLNSAEGQLVGTTPTETLPVYVGDTVTYVLQKPGYRDAELSFVVPPTAAEEVLLKPVELKIYSPPQKAEPWEDQLRQRYRWVEDAHEAILPVGEKEWNIYVEEKKPAADAEFVEVDENGSKRRIVLTNPGDAQAFCWWLARRGHESGYLEQLHQIEPKMEDNFTAPGMSERAKKEGLKPFRPKVTEIPYGNLTVTTEPDGASVSVRTALDGETPQQFAFGPVKFEKLKPGQIEVIAWHEGYKRLEKKVTLGEKESLELRLKLELNQSVVMDRSWKNGLEMEFEPVPLPVPGGEPRKGELMASVYETRVMDFDAYLRANPAANQMPRPQLYQGTNPERHPVTSVTREEAQNFCKWLTEVERKQERITDVHRYRLPTDYEWSVLAGLSTEITNASPAKRDLQTNPVFPWGPVWPPVMEDKGPLGNFADVSALDSAVTPDRIILGYNDNFATTSPVGSFPKNALNLCDVSGNVQEWVEENYSPTQDFGVLRGGSWKSYLPRDLYTGYRYTQAMPVPSPDGVLPPEVTENTYGFRIVLARDAIKPDATAPGVGPDATPVPNSPGSNSNTNGTDEDG